MSAGATLNLTFDYCYIQLELKYSAKVSLKFSAEASLKFPLATVGFGPVPGLNVEVTPAIIFKLTGEISFEGKLEGSVGLRATTQNGGKLDKISKDPECTISIKAKGTYFVGIDLNHKICVISDKIISVGLTEEVGVEFVCAVKTATDTGAEMDIEDIK